MLSLERIEEIKEELQGLSPEEQQKKFQEIIQSLDPEEREQLTGKQQCPFCLMAKGEIPVKKVYEDETLMGILDIRPANKGHTLLFPKEHHKMLSTVPEPLVAHMFTTANKLSTAVFDAMQAQGTNILVANGPAAGQTAPHVLINIIPRFTKDKVVIGWDAEKIDDTEMEKIAGSIQSKIPKEKAKITQKKEMQSVREDFSRIP
ncbi:MAG: Hit-like protein involved in cell-cycle regulation [archaeon GW2011_AR17]|nr:MAG: Hit-like protein involved in cell-cycle regulation [archaeon GW2011_AR17]HIH58556.1 HIT domain-containing protein [Nanoarchaeota archaeon]HIJ05115.1 HIT domain-containing protein [Nanoarchaeota archaeon]